MNAITIGYLKTGKPVMLSGPDIPMSVQRRIMVENYKAEKWPVDIVKAELFVVDSPSVRAIARVEQVKQSESVKPETKNNKTKKNHE